MPRSITTGIRLSASCFKETTAGVLQWDNGLTASWRAEFQFPGGEFHLTLMDSAAFMSQTIRLNAWTNNWGYPRWRFVCSSRSSHKCRGLVFDLYRSESGAFWCHQCAGFDYDSRRNRERVSYPLSKDPEKIRRILSGRHVPIRQKMMALKAVEKIRKRRARLQRKLERLKAEVAKRKDTAS